MARAAASRRLLAGGLASLWSTLAGWEASPRRLTCWSDIPRPERLGSQWGLSVLRTNRTAKARVVACAKSSQRRLIM